MSQNMPNINVRSTCGGDFPFWGGMRERKLRVADRQEITQCVPSIKMKIEITQAIAKANKVRENTMMQWSESIMRLVASKAKCVSKSGNNICVAKAKKIKWNVISKSSALPENVVRLHASARSWWRDTCGEPLIMVIYSE